MRRRRKARGLTREALAARVGIKATYLASIERGETDPRVTTLSGIARALGTSRDDVFAAAEP